VSTDTPETLATLAESEGIGFDLLSDPGREVIGAYGVADAGPELAMPAVFVVRADGVIAWRAIGDSMRDLPSLETVLEAVRAARTPTGAGD
jgi:peroxiredoxin